MDLTSLYRLIWCWLLKPFSFQHTDTDTQTDAWTQRRNWQPHARYAMGNKVFVDRRLWPWWGIDDICLLIFIVERNLVWTDALVFAAIRSRRFEMHIEAPSIEPSARGNVTAATKPEVHNISQRRQRRTELRPETTCTHIRPNGFWDMRVDRQTKQTYSLQYFARNLVRTFSAITLLSLKNTHYDPTYRAPSTKPEVHNVGT